MLLLTRSVCCLVQLRYMYGPRTRTQAVWLNIILFTRQLLKREADIQNAPTGSKVHSVFPPCSANNKHVLYVVDIDGIVKYFNILDAFDKLAANFAMS